MAADLNDLLDRLAPGPFVLAAHSGGGPIVRAVTAARPERVAGLVLVDVTDEACPAIFEKSFVRMEKTAHVASWLLARFGLLEACYRKPVAPLPPDVRDDLHREGFTMAVMRTRGAELAGLRAAMEAFRGHPPVLPDIPVTVISGALADFGMSRRIREMANAAHHYRAQQSRQGRHVVARRSGHAVVLTEPALVADEIRRVLDLATDRDGQTPSAPSPIVQATLKPETNRDRR
jgi:pimeloyl-ACP methyl ester carboxylesterase